MKTFLVIGHTGRGKSTFVKTALRKIPQRKYIYDVNNEYGQGTNLPTLSEFLARAKELRNTTIVFEEATIFFGGAKDEEMTNLLVRKRHTKNNIFLLFHSLIDAPPYILRLVDFIVLYKTNDNPTAIKRKFAHHTTIIQAFEEVAASPDFHARKIFTQ